MKTVALSRSITRVLALICSFAIVASTVSVPVLAVEQTPDPGTVNSNQTATIDSPINASVGSVQNITVVDNSALGLNTPPVNINNVGPSLLPDTSNVNNSGVTVIDFSNLAGGAFNINNINNTGTIYGIAQISSGVNTGIINASSISNYGSITTVLPTGGLPGYSLADLLPNLSLIFNVTQSFTNAGVIASANNLIINATNDTATIVNQATAVIAATNNVTFNAANIINTGAILAGVNAATQAMIASATANNALDSVRANLGNLTNLSGTLTFNNTLSNTLNINNTEGILAGLNINFNALPDLIVKGGDLLAQNLNFNAGNNSWAGSVNVDVNKILGNVHVFGASSNLGVANGDLSIVSMNIIADPLLYNKSGNLLVNFGSLSSGVAGDWTFLSGRDIIATDSVPSTFTNLFGSTALYAGQSFSVSTDGNFELGNKTKSGGSINLSGVNLVTCGGNITLNATAGTNSSGAITVGNLSTTPTVSFMNGGNVNVNGAGPVSIGNVNTSGINAGGFATSNAGSININSANNIIAGSLVANGGNGATPLFFLFSGVNGGNGGDITVKSSKGTITLLGDVVSKGGVGASGVGISGLVGPTGSEGPEFFPEVCLDCFSILNVGNGGNGGNIKIVAKGDLITQKVQSIGGDGGNGGTSSALFPSVGAAGGSGGDSGTIQLISKEGNVVLNDCVGTLGGNGGNGADGSGVTSLFPSLGISGGNGGLGGNARNVDIDAGAAITALKIESFGGNAGNGGNGGAGLIGPGNGGSVNTREDGLSGGSSGNISLKAGSTININDTVETLGGNGGNGGNGANASAFSGIFGGFGVAGGSGGNGGRAGNAGDISVVAQGDVTTGKLLSFGGNGGNGGTGGTGLFGGSGGNGFAGNPWQFFGQSGDFSGGNSGFVKVISVNGNVVLADAVQTVGGAGGSGGNGGNGVSFGAAGGNAGKGGNADNILVEGNNISATTVLSFGGNSGNGGNGGDGALQSGKGGDAKTRSQYGEQDSTIADTDRDAGKSGKISLKAASSLVATGTIQTAGGNGGNGGNGGSQNVGLLPGEFEQFAGGGASGGEGGRGGKAGNIQLIAAGNDSFFESTLGGQIKIQDVFSFGGNGGAGGNGGSGFASLGDGGNGGAGGDSGWMVLQTGPFGKITANGDLQTSGGAGGNGGQPGVSVNLSGFGRKIAGQGGSGGNGGTGSAITLSTFPRAWKDLSGELGGESSLLFVGLVLAFGASGFIDLGEELGFLSEESDVSINFNRALNYPTISAQSIMSFGGNGGAGGNGADGGNGGKSGAINVENLFGATTLNGNVQTVGGNGGAGGSGQQLGISGGNGGNGGDSGRTDITSFVGNINTNRLLSLGGNGGNGGIGAENNRLFSNGGNGGAGGNGGGAGFIKVSDLFGSINLRDTVQTSGGKGGNGGAAGQSQLGSVEAFEGEWFAGTSGGNGGVGGKGGNAGRIAINTLLGNIATRDVLSFGGNGGAGGAGGNAGVDFGDGGNGGRGGKGGNSGYITIAPGFVGIQPFSEESPFGFFSESIPEFFGQIGIDGSVNVNGTLQTKGGDGGTGGAGGNAPGTGGNGGAGGRAGNAKTITVKAFGPVMLNNALSFGGNGGAGGAGGFGSQSGGNGGKGGGANWCGSIEIASLFGSVNVNGALQTAGGDGGAGGAGGASSNDYESSAGKAGKGGNGGTAGSIIIAAPGAVSLNAVMTFGGNGGAGGSGGNGWSGGDGGKGGNGLNGGAMNLSSQTLITLNGPVFKAYGVGGNGGAGGVGFYNGRDGKNGKNGFVGGFSLNSEVVINLENINYEDQACCVGRLSSLASLAANLPRLAVNPVPGESGFCCNPVKPVIIVNSTPPVGNPGDPVDTSKPSDTEFNLPSFFTDLIPTDKTRERGPQTGPDIGRGPAVDILQEVADSDSPNWVVVTNQGKGYVFEGDNGSLIIATPGTIFGQTGDHTLTLKQGSLLVLAGVGVDVQTALGLVSLKPGSAAGVSETRFGALNIANLGTGKVTLSASHNGKTAQVVVAKGEQINVNTSQIATAGASDFVPSADSMKAIVDGLNGITAKVGDTKPFLDMLQSCAPSNLSPGMRTALNGLLQSLLGAAHNGTASQSPLSYQPSIDGKYYVPVAFAAPTTMPLNMDEMSMVTLAGVQARCLVSTQMTTSESGNVNLRDGDVLVDSNEPTQVLAGNCRISVNKKTLALISRKGDIVKVRNIAENSADSITIKVGNNRSIILNAGQEAVVASTKEELNAELKADAIARRHVRAVDSDSEHLAMSEFSIISLCTNSKLMSRMIRSQQSDDKRVYDRMLKMAACLTQVTSSHGAYQQVK